MPACSISAPGPDTDLCRRFALFLRKELEGAAAREIPEPVVRVRAADREGDLTTSAPARAARHLGWPMDQVADHLASALAAHPDVLCIQRLGREHLTWSLKDEALWRAAAAPAPHVTRAGPRPTRVVEATRDDPVFAGLHILARCRAVFTAAETLFDDRLLADGSETASQLGDLSAAERAVARFIALAPCDPNRPPADRLMVLGRLFDALWNEERGPVTLRFLSSGDVKVTQRRLTLLKGVQNVAAHWLGGLGVEDMGELS